MDTLFARSGVSPSTFWRWETERSNPGLLTLEKLRQALEAAEAERQAAA